MKNSAGRGGCYPPRAKAEVDNILQDLHNLISRVLGLLGQRVSARRDSGIIDSIFPENVGSGLMTYG